MIAAAHSLQTRSASPVLSGRQQDSPFLYSRRNDQAVRASRILIIDDEPAVAAVVRKYLDAAGFSNLDTLNDADEALARIESSKPSLVLLDLDLGSASGLQILESVRTLEHLEQLPVVILTQNSDAATKVTALNLGANDFLTKPVNSSELVARVRNTVSEKVCRDQVASYALQLESDVLSDALTGIANRRAFDYELKRRISEWRRLKTPLSLLMIDVDHFKRFNDLYGHDAGNEALVQVAQRLRSSLREMDLVARYGGEEFAVILPATDREAARHACLQAHAAFALNPIRLDDQTMTLHVSMGLSVAADGDDADSLLRRADRALYMAKENGRNCCYRNDGNQCVPLVESAQNVRAETSVSRFDREISASDIHAAKIVIVDDDPTIIALTRKYLRDNGFSRFVSVTDSTTAMDTIHAERPDLVLLDLQMPEVNGLEILHTMRSERQANSIPVLVLTATRDKEAKVEALRLGANDFLEKPLHPKELLVRVRNTLLARGHLDLLEEYSSRLEHQVKLRTTELSASRREAVQCLARAAELRDDVTGRHVVRVGRFAAIIARELGFSEERIDWLEQAAQLHDVGKIGISDAILHKPGKLTEEEFAIMKGHCVAGRSIIRDEVVPNDNVRHRNVFDNLTSPMMHLASVVAATHHEKWDGTGYPQGLKGSDIPIEGRITAIADVFDALSTRRPYKTAIPTDECFRMMEEKRGTHFDPDILDAFLRRRSEILKTASELADPMPAAI